MSMSWLKDILCKESERKLKDLGFTEAQMSYFRNKGVDIRELEPTLKKYVSLGLEPMDAFERVLSVVNKKD
jgi:hypothetical protein